jgi:RNA polymerase sigma-70 factor (ECF subfamily)
MFPTPEHIAVLWKELSTPLRSFIRSKVSDQSTTDDIQQDVFLRMHTRIQTLKEPGKVRSWIYQIARNAIVDHYRSKRVAVEHSGEVHEVPDEEHEQDMIGALAASLREMIEDLPEPYRRAVMLSEIEGLSQKELAKREAISLSGAKSRVQRGRRMLKDLLLNCCHFDFDRRGRIIDYYDHCCCCAGQRPKKRKRLSKSKHAKAV